jgi:hypothetical protein
MSGLLHSLIAIQINEINREFHSEGMNTFARNDPEAFSRRKDLASQKTFSAFSALVSYIYAVGEFRLPRQICDPQAHIRLR